MIVIKEKRNRGKTTKLVELLKKDAAFILLVFSQAEAFRIIREFHLEQSQVLSWDYYFVHPEFWGRTVLIDNVDLYLHDRFKSDIYGVSINEGS